MIAAIQLQEPRAVGVALVLLWVVPGAVAWLYRNQLSITHAPARWMMPVLRAVALSVLVVAFVQPQLVTPVRQVQPGTVAILVDQSRSMSVVDSTRSEPELVHLAAALGALPAGVRSPEVSDLRDAVRELAPIVAEVERSRSEERYARLAGRGIEAAQRHLHDAQNQLKQRVGELVPAAPDELAGMIGRIDGEDAAAQIEQVMARIDQLQSRADQQLYNQNAQVRQIGALLASESRRELVSRALEGDGGLVALISETRPVRVLNISPGGSASMQPGYMDVASAVKSLREEADHRRLAAVIIVSDGQPVPNPPGDWELDASIPAFVVSAAPTVVRDLSIERIWLPDRIFAGQTMHVGVDLSVVGSEATEAHLTIEADGQQQARRVSIIEGHARLQVPIRIDQAGPREVRIGVEALAGEATIENNRASRIVKVVSDRIRVALLAGRPTRDFEYFVDSLNEDPGVIATDRIVESPAQALPAEQIIEQDVVVLVDLPHSALDSRQWDALIRLTNQKGGSVIFATTDPQVAAGYASNPLAAGLLPWRGEILPGLGAWPGAEPVFRIIPATTSSGEPVQLWDESAPGSPRWSDVPPVFRFLSLPPLRGQAQPLLIERDSGLPVLAQLRSGAGRTLFLGIDELWRWRGELDYEHVDRLYARLIHHDSCQQFAASEGALALDAQPLIANPGQPVIVRARSSGPGAVIDLLRGDTVVLSRPLVQEPGKPSLEATLTDLPRGEHRLRLRAVDNSAQIVLPLWVREDFEDEMRDVTSSPDELRRLAGARGEVLTLSEAHTLPARLSRLKEPDPPPALTRLWDSPYLYIFVVACLGLEWAMRKRFGLP